MQPRNPKPTVEEIQRGVEREQIYFVRQLEIAVEERRIAAYAKPDAVVATHTGDVYMVEFKYQEMFEAPPFDGHGLPVKQANRYERIRSTSDLRTLLWVNDPRARTDYMAWLDTLEGGLKFTTKGSVKTPRRVYPLDRFKARKWAA